MTAHFLDLDAGEFTVEPKSVCFDPIALTEEQKAAFDKFMSWWRDPNRPQVFTLFGVAGTGKSELAKRIGREIGPGVVFCTLTGKAAHVLRAKNCPAVTVHSLIKKPLGSPYDAAHGDHADLATSFLNGRKIDCKGEPETMAIKLWHGLRALMPGQKESERLELIGQAVGLAYGTVEKILLSSIDPEFADKELKATPKLIIVDEMSVIDDALGQCLVNLGFPILAIGDPAQLPPISDDPTKEGFFYTPAPDVMLTKIQRQAAESPVLVLAADAREGRPLVPGHYGTSRVLRWRGLIEDQELLLAADAVLCGWNKTRKELNEAIRRALGRKDNMPAPGDKIICLRNHHKTGLLNGSLWMVQECGRLDTVKREISLTITPEEAPDDLDRAKELTVTTLNFDDPSAKVENKLASFYYGFAITVHKAQGSQWSSIVLYDEKRLFRPLGHRWLYTGITRAIDRITVIQFG